MALIEVNWRPDRGQLRGFGLAAAVVFGALSGWCYWRDALVAIELSPDTARVTAAVLGGLALVCAVLSAVAPTAIRPLYVGLTALALPIGVVVSYVVLGFLYFIVLTPIGLFFRIIGRDVLLRRFEPDAPTYWIPRSPVTDVKRYFRQF